jgi:hypothetical protein
MLTGHREEREKIRPVERNMHLSVHCGSACLDIGNVEHVLVRSAGKTDG